MLFIVSATLWASQAAASPAALRYRALMLGKPAGSVVCQPASAAEQTCDYEFNDRGRGPGLHQTLALDASGLPARMSITGHDYFKVPVEETLTREGDRLIWKSHDEQGAASAAASFYWPLNSLPTDAGILYAALRRSPTGRLHLLPSGEASFERLEERTVKVGSGAHTVTHVAISGLGLTPALIWVDDQGFFADATGWLAIVREGFDDVVPELAAADKAADSAYFARIGPALTHRPRGPVALEHAALFDPSTGTVAPGSTILIGNGRVVAVGLDGAVPLPSEAERVDARGKTVLPGLWDMHAHVAAQQGLLDIAAGVTSVRDLANEIDLIQELKTEWDSGHAVGPRLHRAGIIDGTGPYSGPFKVLVDNEKDAVAWVDRYADLGYEQIKIYSSVKPELVPPIIAEAHKRGLRVSGHVPAFMTAEQCVRLGFDEIQHVNFLFLNFFAKEVKDTRTPARFHALGERAAGLDLASGPVQRFIALLRERKIVSDPTLQVFEGWFRGRPGTVSPNYATVADRLPPLIKRALLGGGLAPAGQEERYSGAFAAMQRMVHELYLKGVPLVAGTDSWLAGFALHRELELWVDAGIPAPVVLRIATLDAARVMKSDTELGSISPGKLADLVLVDGDPTVRISDIRKVWMVFKDGVRFDPAEIDRAIGVKPTT